MKTPVCCLYLGEESLCSEKINNVWTNLSTFNVKVTNGLLTTNFLSAISMEYDTKNPHITNTDTNFFMPFGPPNMSEGSKSFEHDFQNGYTVHNNVLALDVLVPPVSSDSSGCY